MKLPVLAAMAAAQLLLTTGAEACNQGRETCSFVLFNNTTQEVQSFWASPSRVTKWEDDILGRGTLKAGHQVTINVSDGRPDCIYDFRIKYSSGRVFERKTINVCKLGRYTLNE